MNHDPLAVVKHLAASGADEPTPATDVSDRVMRTLAAYRPAPPPLAWDDFVFGACSIATACAAAFAIWATVSNDALLSFAQPFITVMP